MYICSTFNSMFNDFSPNYFYLCKHYNNMVCFFVSSFSFHLSLFYLYIFLFLILIFCHLQSNNESFPYDYHLYAIPRTVLYQRFSFLFSSFSRNSQNFPYNCSHIYA